MKKYINISFIYAVLALMWGVFYREFTKYAGFTGKTSLSAIHVHLFVLGMFMFLVIALFSRCTTIVEQKQFKYFMVLYNTGLLFVAIMMTIRGIVEALQVQLSSGMSAAISGMAGISHIILSAGIVLLFISLNKGCKDR